MKITDAEQFIETELKFDIEEIVADTTYWYLACNQGEWVDAYNVKHTLDSMDEKYLKNCINEIEKGIAFCKQGYTSQKSGKGKEYVFESLEKILKKKISMSDQVKDTLKKYIEERVTELLEEKKAEIQNELNSR